MAATQGDRAPGRRSRAHARRRSSSGRTRVIADPLSIYLPVVIERGARRDAHGRRRQHVHRLHRRRRLPQRRALLTRRSSRRRRSRLAKFSHTDFTIVPYEAYVTLAERLVAHRPDLRAGEGGVLQRRNRGGRERGQVRARVHEAARGDRLRGRLPRPHAAVDDAHLEDASVQGGPRAVRAGGLPRSVRRRTTAGRAPPTRSLRSSAH